MKHIPLPVIGYVGTINSTRLDSDLLLRIAEKRPAYSFVFTGPEDEVFSKHPIHKLSNVYFLGEKRSKLCRLISVVTMSVSIRRWSTTLQMGIIP